MRFPFFFYYFIFFYSTNRVFGRVLEIWVHTVRIRGVPTTTTLLEQDDENKIKNDLGSRIEKKKKVKLTSLCTLRVLENK